MKLSHSLTKYLLIAILVFTALSRLIHLDYPRGYVFDEVYHAFTAKEYLKGDVKAWEWWNTPPAGVAYEWTHPPLAKEIMAASMALLHSTLAVDGSTPIATQQQNLPFWQAESFGYRLPGVLLGILSVFLVFKLGKLIFKSDAIGLVSAFAFSVDGLNFVQSRTGMNDIYIVTFVLLSLLLMYQKRFILAAIAFGLAIASKWSGIYFLAVVIGLFAEKFRKASWKFIYFLIIPIVVYLLTYAPFFGVGTPLTQITNLNQPFFSGGHSWNQFISIRDFFDCQLLKLKTCPEPFGLQNQMYYYHTNLKATHDYSSPWWSWPLSLYPVWYFVDYNQSIWWDFTYTSSPHPSFTHPTDGTSNIFAAGNPIMFLLGFIAVIISLVELCNLLIKKRKLSPVFIPLLGYLSFWLPWVHSPRIMFLYHYSPSVPFMALLLGYQLHRLYLLKYKTLFWVLLGFILLGFVVIYPWLVGIPLPNNIMLFFFHLNLTKDPFGSVSWRIPL